MQGNEYLEHEFIEYCEWNWIETKSKPKSAKMYKQLNELAKKLKYL